LVLFRGRRASLGIPPRFLPDTLVMGAHTPGPFPTFYLSDNSIYLSDNSNPDIFVDHHSRPVRIGFLTALRRSDIPRALENFRGSLCSTHHIGGWVKEAKC